MRACSGCGRISVGKLCTTCAAKIGPGYNSSEYRTNRATLLSTARVCWICGGPPTNDDPLTADHFISIAAGGGHGLDNLRAAHSTCNKRRGGKMGQLFE
jgi:5-methylcytosine-specific restriction endonuclease McrA